MVNILSAAILFGLILQRVWVHLPDLTKHKVRHPRHHIRKDWGCCGTCGFLGR